MAETQDPETRTLRGGCHCGAVRYTVETDLSTVMECNCSHCAKKGFLLTFVPPEKFDLQADRASLTEYRFNTHNIAHVFCPTCGVQSFAEGVGPGGQPMRAINVRCLEDVDLAGLKITPVDGRSR